MFDVCSPTSAVDSNGKHFPEPSTSRASYRTSINYTVIIDSTLTGVGYHHRGEVVMGGLSWGRFVGRWLLQLQVRAMRRGIPTLTSYTVRSGQVR